MRAYAYIYVKVMRSACGCVCVSIYMYANYNGTMAGWGNEYRPLSHRVVGTNPQSCGHCAAHTMKRFPPDGAYASQHGHGIKGPAFLCRFTGLSWVRRHSSCASFSSSLVFINE